jgi:cell division protein ZapB
MATLQDLATRIDRLLLRHEELERTNKLLLQEVASLSSERDSLKSRLTAAHTRIDSLLERLPSDDQEPKDDAR